MVAPRMFMVSRLMVSRPLGVILTVRSAVFICGETDAMVPWTIVPVVVGQRQAGAEASGQKRTILHLNSDRLILALHQKPEVVLAVLRQDRECALTSDGRQKTHLTSFMLGAVIQ